MDTKRVLARLHDPDFYELEIERLRRKYAKRGKLDARAQEGVTLSALTYRARGFAKALARSVKREAYEFSLHEEHLAFVGGKIRPLFKAQISDAVVSGVASHVVDALVKPFLSDRVFSYRKGKSNLSAFNELKDYLAGHRNAHPDPRGRGLYVLQRDIQDYGPTTRIDDNAQLWQIFEELMTGRQGVPAGHYIYNLMKQMLRPPVIDIDGNYVQYRIGIPTGTAFQTTVSNVYLMRLDARMEQFAGAFYARFSDDFLFAHPDPDVAREASQAIDDVAASLELSCHPAKRQDIYFTGCGRASAAWPATRPNTCLEYLGYRIAFNGKFGFKRKKARLLMLELQERIRSSCRLTVGLPDAQVMRALCQVVNRALEPGDRLSHHRAGLLRFIVTDREQLAQFDYAIAKLVAEALSGVRGPRAFRHFPYRRLREEGGLISLVAHRNRCRELRTARKRRQRRRRR